MNALNEVEKNEERDKAKEFIKKYIQNVLNAICPNGGIIEQETLAYILENTGITPVIFDKIASEFFSEKEFKVWLTNNKRNVEK